MLQSGGMPFERPWRLSVRDGVTKKVHCLQGAPCEMLIFTVMDARG